MDPDTRNDLIVDDFTAPRLLSRLGTRWRAFSDQVMGGVSDASLARASIAGRTALQLGGEVRLDNGGGFVQAALDLDAGAGTLDASRFTGLRLVVRGNGERYGAHLRTPDTLRPWQSWRAGFVAGETWREVRLPFSGFAPHRIDAPLDVARLRRLGLVAIGRAFRADLAVAEVGFYA